MDQPMNHGARQPIKRSRDPLPLVAIACTLAVFGVLAALTFVFHAYNWLTSGDPVHSTTTVNWEVVRAWIEVPLVPAQVLLLGGGAYALFRRSRVARVLVLAGCAVALGDAVTFAVCDWLWSSTEFNDSLQEWLHRQGSGLAIRGALPLLTAFVVSQPVVRTWLASSPTPTH